MRLTERKSGEWKLKGLEWESFREGEIITKEMREKIYGALCKLKCYEDTELSPEDVERLNDFEKTQLALLLEKLSEERKKNEWTPAEIPPEKEGYILLSFENFSIPLVGRYEEDENGGTYYIGGEVATCLSQDLYVNAWMILPDSYKGKIEGK